MSLVVTGAKVKFILKGNVVAYATAMDYNISHEMVPVYTIDRLTPHEYAETGYSCSFSVSRFRVPKNEAQVGSGSPMELGWQPPISTLLVQGEMTAEFQMAAAAGDGTKTYSTILVFEGVKMANRSGTMAARDLATERLDFVALRAYDEGSNSAANTEQ